MNKRPIKLKPGYYDPADYLLVHKDHYADLIERTKTRIEGPAFKIDTDGILRAIQTAPETACDCGSPYPDLAHLEGCAVNRGGVK